MKAPRLIGRLLFGGFFLKSGIDHLRHRKEMKPYVESKGLPVPQLMVTLSAIPLLVGGTSLLLGIKPKWGALSIVGFLTAVSPLMHDFWNSEDPQERAQSQADFMKNVALAGAALALTSLDDDKRSVQRRQLQAPAAAEPSIIDTIAEIGRELAA
jgi:putative oxidoreductase